MTHPTFRNPERRLAYDEAACARPTCPLRETCLRAHPQGGERQVYFAPMTEPCDDFVPR